VADKYLKITLVRSPIGYKRNQRVTAKSLGLRKLQSTVIHKATPQIRGMVFQLRHLLEVEELDNYSAPEKSKSATKAQAKAAPAEAAPVKAAPAPKKAAAKPAAKAEAKAPEAEPVAAEPVAESPAPVEAAPAPKAKKSKAADGDDLTRIEGIGPKMSGALKTAGIDTFAKLAASDQDALKKAIEDAGMNLAPSIETWAEQAKFAADGDWDGLKQLQGELVGGRRVN
jgi:ribosomal protein L30